MASCTYFLPNMIKKDISANFNQECLTLSSKILVNVTTKYKLNSFFFTMATYWVPDLPTFKAFLTTFYGKPIVAIFNSLIYIQFSIYIYVILFLFIQFNIYIYAIFLNPFNLICLYLFNSIAQYPFNLIPIYIHSI